MELSREEIQSRMDRFTKVLRDSGIKMTHQRIEIFREVARTGDHPDAETIFKGVRQRMPTVSLDTIYRTLWLLMDLGLVTTLGSPRERVRFDGNVSPHHHFFCTQCGRVRDVHSKNLDDLKVPGAVEKLGRVETTHVEFRGQCSLCSKKDKKN